MSAFVLFFFKILSFVSHLQFQNLLNLTSGQAQLIMYSPCFYFNVTFRRAALLQKVSALS